MRFIKLIILAAFVMLAIVGCGSYQKLLKSTDSEKKYSEAVRLFYDKEYNKSIALLSNVVGVFQGTPREDTIMFYYAKALYGTESYEESADLMNSFRHKFTRSSFLEESEYLYAMCNYRMSGTFERDQAASLVAIRAFTEYLNRYPQSIKSDDIYEMIDELSRKLYLKRYSNAAVYYKLGKYNAAITALKSTLKEYPEIPYKEDIMYLICKSWFDYAENSVHARQLDRYMNMMDSYYSYKSEFPEDAKRKKELDAMFAKSKKFSEENGYQAKAIAKDKIDIETRKNRIMEKKDKRFYATGKEERQKITDEINYEIEQLKKDRKLSKESKEEQRFQQKQVKNKLKLEKKLKKTSTDNEDQ